jgi:hypothetical protein
MITPRRKSHKMPRHELPGPKPSPILNLRWTEANRP